MGVYTETLHKIEIDRIGLGGSSPWHGYISSIDLSISPKDIETNE